MSECVKVIELMSESVKNMLLIELVGKLMSKVFSD